MLQIKEGGFYMKRNGQIIGPAKRLSFSECFSFWFPFDGYRQYSAGGSTSESGWIKSEHDLVAEVIADVLSDNYT